MPIGRNPEIDDFMQESFDENEKFQIENATTVRYYDESEVLDGYTIFITKKVNTTTSSVAYIWNLVIVNMSGHIIGGFNSSTTIQALELINSTTVMFLTKYNIALYNIRTGILENASIPSGHHDVEYNPYTDTFLVLSKALNGIYNGLPIRYDDIYEYDKDGNVLWFWNCSTHLPFNTNHYSGEVLAGTIDWTHTNTLFWNFEENVIYYNSRNLDTFYKINKTTGEFICQQASMVISLCMINMVMKKIVYGTIAIQWKVLTIILSFYLIIIFVIKQTISIKNLALLK